MIARRHCRLDAAAASCLPGLQVLGYCAETWNSELDEQARYRYLHKQHVNLLKDHADLLNEHADLLNMKVTLLRENQELSRRAWVFEQAWKATAHTMLYLRPVPDVD